MPAVSAGLLSGDIVQQFETTYRSIQSGTQPVTSIELIVRDGVAKSLVTLGGARPRALAFNALGGAPVPDWRTAAVQVGNGYFAGSHQTLKRIHCGDIIGHFDGRHF